MRFHDCHFFQQFAGLFGFARLDIKLAEITHCLEIFFDSKGLCETFYCVIRTSHTLCTQTVIFEDLESFPVVFLFFTFRCF